jgi:serine/threonine protein kinase
VAEDPTKTLAFPAMKSRAGEMYIAMTFYKGESLRERLERGPLPPAEVLDIAVQVAEGLAKAHGLGVVHRDVKPGFRSLRYDPEFKALLKLGS